MTFVTKFGKGFTSAIVPGNSFILIEKTNSGGME